MVGRLPRLLLCCLALLTGALAGAPRLAVASVGQADRLVPSTPPVATAPWEALPALADTPTEVGGDLSPSWHRGSGRRQHRGWLSPVLGPQSVGSIPASEPLNRRAESTPACVIIPPDDTARLTSAPRPPPPQY